VLRGFALNYYETMSIYERHDILKRRRLRRKLDVREREIWASPNGFHAKGKERAVETPSVLKFSRTPLLKTGTCNEVSVL